MRDSNYSTHSAFMIRMAILVWLSVLFSPASLWSQSHKIDSIRQLLKNAKDSGSALQYLLALGMEKNSLPADSILAYASRAKKIAVSLKDPVREGWADYNLLAYLLANGKADSVLNSIDPYITSPVTQKDRLLYFKLQLLKANALNRQNRLNEAMDLQLTMLNQADKENATEMSIFLMNYIGATYLNLGKSDVAHDWWNKAIHIISTEKENNFHYIEATLYSNIGLFYYNHTDPKLFDSCGIYLEKCIYLSKKYEYYGLLASALSLKGNFLSRLGKFKEAETSLNEGIQLRLRIGDPFYTMQDIDNLGVYYYSLKQYDKSISTVKQAIAIAEANHLKADRLQQLALLGYSYKAKGDHEAYSKVLEQFILVADSANRINSSLQLAEIQTKYDVQQKELRIAEQNFTLTKRNYLLYGSLLLLLVGSITGYIGFRNYRARQQLFLELKAIEEKKEIEKAIRTAEENERTRIAADLHDNIGVQASAILYGTELLQTGEGSDPGIVNNLHDTAKEMLINLRETLWAMNNSEIMANDFWIRVINFGKQMSKHYRHLQITASGNIPPHLNLPTTAALHLMMIVKESVNNAAKHSGAGKISIVSSIHENLWELRIEDDGKGFDHEAAAQTKDGNGIRNMTERAKAIGAQFHLESATDKGTIARLQLPIEALRQQQQA